MVSCSFTHGVFVKTDNYVFINTWNTEFYIPLWLRQNESRYKLWHWLELGWLKEVNKYGNLTYGMVMVWRYGFILTLSYFIFWPCWFLFTYVVLIWLYSDLCNAQGNLTCTWKIYFQVTTSPGNKVLSSPSNKVWQVLVASTMPCTIWSSAIFKLFFIDVF